MYRRKALQNIIITCAFGLSAPMQQSSAFADTFSPEGMFEWTFQSSKYYKDPFNDVDVDVVFSREGKSWRVPTFWRGGQKWTVRFTPPSPGSYSYRLDSTDKSNADLNGHETRVNITPYLRGSSLLKHGGIQISSDKRHFVHSDGEPFYWLGDTWWTGLSSRLSWEDFQRLTADRAAKGFTVVQMVAGLVPEELCPADPGCENEGGPVWDAQFNQINPKYFDFADRRIQHLVNTDIAPAIVGAWGNVLDQIGVAKIKKHWRYIIARYGAYPVFWIVGGEVFDPPEAVVPTTPEPLKPKHPGAWTDAARYIRAIDPYHHPIAVHEASADDPPLQKDALTDFRLFQPSHYGWPSIGVEVAQLDLHYSRTGVTKPLVVGEVGYEMLGGIHLQDFQRVAFWLAMLNGSAGYSYGAAGTWESYTADKRFPRKKWSLLTWEEGMNLPGSYQVGLGAKLLRQYPWWKFEPHPEWVIPGGTTLFEPRPGVDEFHIDLMGDWNHPTLGRFPESEWKKRKGDFRLPYAAGIPKEVRFVYLPSFGLIPPHPPTILGLEPGVRYHAYYWEPSLGVKIDLGVVERSASGKPIFKDNFASGDSAWTDYGTRSTRSRGKLTGTGQMLAVINGVQESNLVVAVTAQGGADAGLVMRYKDANNYLAAIYSAEKKSIYLVEHIDGMVTEPLGTTAYSVESATFRLSAEVRGEMGVVSIAADGRTTTTPIVAVSKIGSGGAGLMCSCGDATQQFEDFELMASGKPIADDRIEGKLHDASGKYRGESPGHGIEAPVQWKNYGLEKHLLLDAYRPEEVATSGDWLLVLDARASMHDAP